VGSAVTSLRLHEALEHGVRIDPVTGLDAQSQPVGADQLQATRSGLPPLRLHNHLRRELNERRGAFPDRRSSMACRLRTKSHIFQ
jgi:hypothetical protein